MSDVLSCVCLTLKADRSRQAANKSGNVARETHIKQLRRRDPKKMRVFPKLGRSRRQHRRQGETHPRKPGSWGASSPLHGQGTLARRVPHVGPIRGGPHARALLRACRPSARLEPRKETTHVSDRSPPGQIGDRRAESVVRCALRNLGRRRCSEPRSVI